MIKGGIKKSVRSIRSVGAQTKSGAQSFFAGDTAAKKKMAVNGQATARDQLRTYMTSDQTIGGRGLTTMRNHRARTGMVVGAGMGVAAAMRSTGPGTSQGSNSFYRY